LSLNELSAINTQVSSTKISKIYSREEKRE